MEIGNENPFTKLTIPLFAFVEYQGFSCIAKALPSARKLKYIWKYTKEEYIADKEFLENELFLLQKKLNLKDSTFSVFGIENREPYKKSTLPFCINPLLHVAQGYEIGYEFFQNDYTFREDPNTTDINKRLYFIY